MVRKNRQMPKTAKCKRCGKRIYKRKSGTTGRMSLFSGIRHHYWEKHRTTMMKGVKKREQKKNPNWRPKRRRR